MKRTAVALTALAMLVAMAVPALAVPGPPAADSVASWELTERNDEPGAAVRKANVANAAIGKANLTPWLYEHFVTEAELDDHEATPHGGGAHTHEQADLPNSVVFQTELDAAIGEVDDGHCADGQTEIEVDLSDTNATVPDDGDADSDPEQAGTILACLPAP